VSHAENKVKWCLKKAEKELKEGKKQRGLVKVKQDMDLANKHILKAEHNLKAIIAFKNIGFSDWSAPATFYSIYHALLAVLAKFGYESGNQECTFALIYQLIDAKQISLDKNVIEEIHGLNPEAKSKEPSIIEVRESEQYGVSIRLKEKTYERLLSIARRVLDQAKLILEE